MTTSQPASPCSLSTVPAKQQGSSGEGEGGGEGGGEAVHVHVHVHPSGLNRQMARQQRHMLCLYQVQMPKRSYDWSYSRRRRKNIKQRCLPAWHHTPPSSRQEKQPMMVLASAKRRIRSLAAHLVGAYTKWTYSKADPITAGIAPCRACPSLTSRRRICEEFVNLCPQLACFVTTD
jgi:hypothetical protein